MAACRFKNILEVGSHFVPYREDVLLLRSKIYVISAHFS